MTATHRRHSDEAPTSDIEICTPPCAYAKALMWVMGVAVVAIAAMMSSWRSNDRAIIELRKDVQYIRQTLDEVRATQAALLRRDLASLAPHTSDPPN